MSERGPQLESAIPTPEDLASLEEEVSAAYRDVLAVIHMKKEQGVLAKD